MKLEYGKLYATVTFKTKCSTLNMGGLVLCSHDRSYFTIREDLLKQFPTLERLKHLFVRCFEQRFKKRIKGETKLSR
jgi:hypothetical protein